MEEGLILERPRMDVGLSFHLLRIQTSSCISYLSQETFSELNLDQSMLVRYRCFEIKITNQSPPPPTLSQKTLIHKNQSSPL